MIDPATVQRINDVADIVEVVGDYVHLIRRGANYMGLCPFHNERTPSFSVNKQRNFCYCFSCKKGGSPVNFIMEKEGLNYHEALLHLAKKYGIEVVERELSDEERAKQSERESMFVANEWAMQHMEKNLTETEEGCDIGLTYLTQRGVTDAAIKAFHLGYALDKGYALTEAAGKAGFDINVFKKLGLIGTSQQGRDYDRFRGRVIFPILNTAGKVIAFGGRDLKGGIAKYINSPESELYKKSNELYGIYQAKSAIVSEKKCFLVEGYMDVIGMWQCGMKNVVASSGTALTDGQIAMIHRFTDDITLIYDGDAAGIKASLRGIDMLVSHNLKVKVLLLPDGDDPDSFARKHTPEEFRKYVEEHETDIIRFKAQVMLDTLKNDPQHRIDAINSVVTSIAHIPDNVARDVYVQECSMILNIPEESIAKSVARARAQIVQKMKQDRLRKQQRQSSETQSQSSQIPNLSQNAQLHAHTSESLQQHESDQETVHGENVIGSYQVSGTINETDFRDRQASNLQLQSPLYPLEKAVIKYCVRYSFMKFCSYEDTTSQEQSATPRIVTLDVLSFVEEELRDSNMKFSVSLFSRMFDLLKDMRNGFETYSQHRTAELEERLSQMRKDGYDKISEKALSVDEIRREEQKLEQNITTERETAIKEICKDYPCRILGSHEDDDIRRLALELMMEKHHLSNIYLKDGTTELEEDRLSVLLVRALDEWKNELINQKIRELLKKFHAASRDGNIEKQTEIQAELNSLMNMRKEMSKYIGERIVFK